MASIGPSSLVTRSKDPSGVQLNGELVMMDTESEKYLGLNSVAARVWEILESNQSIIGICQILQQEYNIDKDTCISDVSACIEEMRSLGLVHIT